MDRPYVICHMLASLDGRIDGDFMRAQENAAALKEYARIRGTYACDATLYGTITMAESYSDGWRAVPAPTSERAVPAPLSERLFTSPAYAHEADSRLTSAHRAFARKDYVAQTNLQQYVVSVDAGGQLAFSGNTVERPGRPKAHIIEVLLESVSDDSIAYLREREISYVFAGKNSLDCGRMLRSLKALFGIKRLMAAGGGVMNGTLIREGLVDELSVVLSPLVEGNSRCASLAEYAGARPKRPAAFHPLSAEPLGDAIHIRLQSDGRRAVPAPLSERLSTSST